MNNDIESNLQDRTPAPKRVRKLAIWLSTGLVLALVLAACSGTVPGTSIHISTGSTATPTTSTAPKATTTPATSTSSGATTTASATPPASGTTTSTPSSVVTDAIKGVIQKANQEQQQAFANQDSSVMQDTATTSYYNELVQIQQQLTSSGVTAIKLDKLTWGDITLQGSNSAQATTSETWSTTLKDSSTVQSTDTNVYTLVLQDGSWKIQADQQPNSGLQPATGNTSPGGSGSGSTVPLDQPSDASQSANWSGYYASGGTVTSVSGSWTIPTVSASSSAGADATWVGIGGVTSTDLIQAGTDATVEGNQVVYQAWIETLPQVSQTVPLAVNAGDSVTTSITEQSIGVWQITIKDNTTSQTYKTTVNYSSSESSAEWIEESPSGGRGQLPLDNFDTVNFTNATAVVNGQQKTIQQAGGQAITMNNGMGQALAQPSTLGSDGESFSVTRTSATSTSGFSRGGFQTYP